MKMDVADPDISVRLDGNWGGRMKLTIEYTGDKEHRDQVMYAIAQLVRYPAQPRAVHRIPKYSKPPPKCARLSCSNPPERECFGEIEEQITDPRTGSIYRTERSVCLYLCKAHAGEWEKDSRVRDAHTVPTNSSPLGTRSEQSEGSDSAD